MPGSNTHTTRRRLLAAAPVLLVAPAIIRPDSAWAALGTGFCPPVMTGGGGGGTDDLTGGEGTEDLVDFTGVVPPDGPGERSVSYHNKRGDSFSGPYMRDGAYIPEALAKFRHISRDGGGNSHTMDPRLLDILWSMTQMLGTTAPWRINSGYRSPGYNASLRKKGVKAAKGSLHMKGLALDLHQPQKSPRAVYAAARSLKRGGCGSYSSFTHVDTGPIRTWSG